MTMTMSKLWPLTMAAVLSAGCSSKADADNGAAGASAFGADAAPASDGGAGSMPVSAGEGGASAGSCAALPNKLVRARDHLDAWGVNYCPDGTSTDIVAGKLNQIGIRRLRCPLAQSSLGNWQALASSMVSQGFAKPALKFNDLVIAYMNDTVSWDDQKAPILAAAASGLLTSVEGPNEMNNPYVGEGTHGVNDRTNRTTDWSGPSGNVFQWAKAIHEWKTGLSGSDATTMAGVALYAPTIASGEKADYDSLPNLTGLVDFGNVHYYSGSALQPNLSQGIDNPGVGYFQNVRTWCEGGMNAGGAMVMTECGASTPPGEQYSGHAQAAYLLNQLHDAAGSGLARVYFYTFFDPSTGTGGVEGNYGLFKSDTGEKPIAVALGNVKHLFSLNNNYDDPANAADTSCFTPGYSGSGLSVTGIGQSGYSSRVADAVVYPKSDGSSLISITNEPPLTNGSGGDSPPAAVTATVAFGSAQSWRLYDPLSATPLTPVASGTGATMEVPLLGYPKYIILDPPAGYMP